MKWLRRLFHFTESEQVREQRRKDTDRVRKANEQRREAIERHHEQVSTICLPPKVKTP